MLGKGFAVRRVHWNGVSGTVIDVSVLGVLHRSVLFGGIDTEVSCLQLTVKWLWQKVCMHRH